MDSESSTGYMPSSVHIERFVSAEINHTDPQELFVENTVRPQKFSDYPGQNRAKENLRVYVEAAKKRQKALDHVLLHGPPGLGKTSLARIIAFELGVPFVQTSGPAIDKPGDLAGILAGLEKNTVLFIDEIHRLSIAVEEILYTALEDFCIDIVVGQAAAARTVRMPLQPFTLIGATTRVSSLSAPLLSRFGINERFEYYDVESLKAIILRSAKIEGIAMTEGAAQCLAERARGTPRIANRLLRRVRDFAVVHGEDKISQDRVEYALSCMEIDRCGLEPLDRKILDVILKQYKGGPVGIDALAHTLGEDRATIEDVYEPFLVYRGFITRGARGREITQSAKHHLNQLNT